MTLGLRKLCVVSLVAGIVVIGNLLVVTSWLDERGVIEGARQVREEFLTGTAITVLVALLVLLVPQRGTAEGRRCPVCDSRLKGGKYCGECGSRVG